MTANGRFAVLTMEVEDWYHLDYFSREQCDASQTLLDGLDRYMSFLAEHALPSSLFVLGEIAAQVRAQLLLAIRQGHDLGCHGWNHCRPLRMTTAQFRSDLRRASDAIGEITGEQPKGYRAPCFSLDCERLEIVRDAGFLYDSSGISLNHHAGRRALDLSGLAQIAPHIFRSADFCAFEVGTLRMLGRHLPVSSGGYVRQLPWWLMSRLTRRYLESGQLYVLYVHPFELSDRPAPRFPASATARARLRFSLGRDRLLHRLAQLVRLLKQHGYVFTTFRSLREQLIAQNANAIAHDSAEAVSSRTVE